MIIFYIYVINHILDYLSTCLRNSQLASCYEPVVDKVGVPVEEDQHLLHQVRECNVPLPKAKGVALFSLLFRMVLLLLLQLVTRLYVTWGLQF